MLSLPEINKIAESVRSASVSMETRCLDIGDQLRTAMDTIGGLIFLLAGHVPKPGEVVAHPDGPLFEVMDADSRRVRRLRVRMPAEAR